jgi:hypothetical protein
VSAGGANASVFRHATAQSLRVVGLKFLRASLPFISQTKLQNFRISVSLSIKHERWGLQSGDTINLQN